MYITTTLDPDDRIKVTPGGNVAIRQQGGAATIVLMPLSVEPIDALIEALGEVRVQLVADLARAATVDEAVRFDREPEDVGATL
jgi:hypothetical protein